MEDTQSVFNLLVLAVGTLVFLWAFLPRLFNTNRKYPPAVQGLPFVGNLLQLKEKRPFSTFTEWAKKYGPIYSIRTGAHTVIVLNSSELAKEALVTKYSSISTRRLPKSLQILTRDKTMVAMSDYGDEHRLLKKLILAYLLGPAAQKQNRFLRDEMVKGLIKSMQSELKGKCGVVNVREKFLKALFPFALKQVLGRDVECVYVEELGATVSKWEMHSMLVTEFIKGAIDVDWRDFFPYLRWIPNRSFERRVMDVERKRTAIMKAVIRDQKQLIASGKKANCYLDILLTEAKYLTEKQLEMAIWESIIESADTVLVTWEWIMFELGKNPNFQDRLYKEVKSVCGEKDVTEDDLPNLPYMNAVFQETLRKHPPVPILPLRYVHQDVEIGGYYIPAGCQIAVNIYGCHREETEWKEAERWNPERHLSEGVKEELIDVRRTMAFGGGRRMCAGIQQAMVIACTSVGRAVQEFSWQLGNGEEESVGTATLTTQRLHPLMALATPRNPKTLYD